MRRIVNFNKGWSFKKDAKEGFSELDGGFEMVDLPHTWNASDGQDGGNDYFRGVCCYSKKIKMSELPKAERYYLEINGANSSAEVYIDGELLARHDGGYSSWRVDISGKIADGSVLTVKVDNLPNDYVYPQMADFTFYGGLYRDVNIICVSESHFELEYYGASGIAITPKIKGLDAEIDIKVFVKNFKSCQTLIYTIYDAEENEVGRTESDKTNVKIPLKNVRLWHGKKDPYLYTCTAELLENDVCIDNVSAKFGCRTFKIDSDKGFILNGEEYPLRGVSRHQDRARIGNALLNEHHEEDIELICELGATAVRLAHYQHAQRFYELCDERGLIVWAEIPYISRHMSNGYENTLSQMKELVLQNYNHPSIVVWGLSNEITIGGDGEGVLENHKALNDLCHSLDKTRLTAVAAVSMCETDNPYLKIPDLVAYNHYFGWYGGETEMNGEWFDSFHRKYPNIPIGCSEYGCEALNWHTSEPKQGDYTEEYQAYYHEELIKQLFTRKYLWATYVWNMFDFGADARAEGGENGQNHKGLVTIDRKYKKDAFYAYKAWLSDEPFVHICGKRYVDRTDEKAKITVYSNQPEVELFANGKSVERKSSEDHFFRFEVNNEGETLLEAKAGSLCDESRIRRVYSMNTDYILKEKGAVLNWFDIKETEGCYSVNDKISDIMKSDSGRRLITKAIKSKIEASDGVFKDLGLNPSSEKENSFAKMLGGFTVLRFASLFAVMNDGFTKDELLRLNEKLNKIKKSN